MQLLLVVFMLTVPSLASAQSVVIYPPRITDVRNTPDSPPPAFSVNVTANIDCYPRYIARVLLLYFTSIDRVNRTVPMVPINGNQTSGRYFGTIPANVSISGVSVTYFVVAIDSSGFEGATNAKTLPVEPDQTPPTFPVEHPPKGQFDTPILNYTRVEVSVEIADSGSGVKQAWVHYSNSSDQRRVMNLSAPLELSEGDRWDGLWTGLVPAMSPGTVYYHVAAMDYAGNEAESDIPWHYQINPWSAFPPSAHVQVVVQNIDLATKTLTVYLSLNVIAPSRVADSLHAEVNAFEPSGNYTSLEIPRQEGFTYARSYTSKIPIFDINLWPFDSYVLNLTITLFVPGLNGTNTYIEPLFTYPAGLQFDAYVIGSGVRNKMSPDQAQIFVEMQLTRRPSSVEPIMQAIYAVFLVLGSAAFIRPTKIARRLEMFLGLFTFIVILYFTLTPILQNEGITKIIGLSVPQALLIGLIWSVSFLTSASLLIAYVVQAGLFDDIIRRHRCLLRHGFNFGLAGAALLVTWWFSSVFVGFSPYLVSEYSHFLFAVPEVRTAALAGLFGPSIVATALDLRLRHHWRALATAALIVLAILVGLGMGFDFSTFFLVWIWPFIVAIVMIAVADKLRKPSLEIQFREEPVTAERRRWVHIFVYNNPLRLIARNHAAECKGRVTYTSLETNQTKGPFYTSWASTPTPETIQFDSSGKPVGHMIAATAVALRYIGTIAPGAEPKALDIAVKFDGEADAWIWTPESYYNYKRDGSKRYGFFRNLA